uniref:F-box domain-containing protein n=1 Tax=Plectus sambesii TaxID=2011161 RepID=A0A914WYZ5_9BILA
MEEELGAMLQRGPHIIECILRTLSARELHRVSRVCRAWQKYAALLLKERRRRIVMMAVTKQKQRTSHAVIVDNPDTKRFLRDLDMECRLAIMFLTGPRPSYAYSSPVATPSLSANMNFKTMHSYLTSSSTLFGAVCSSGIIGTSSDGSYHEQQQSAVDCMDAILVPKLLPEGTRMSQFSLSLTRAKELAKSELDRATLAQTLQWPKDQVIKCVILVSSQFVPSQVDRKLLSAIRGLHDGQVALAGGVADEVYSSACVKPALVGLVFGGENVRATSLVIGQDDRTKESVRERLAELKANVEAWGKCRQKFGFMFAWCGRGCTLFEADNVVAGAFKELMPNIPLTGMFSLGEYGWDFPLPLAQSAEKPKSSDVTLLRGTTSFAVVGFV